MAEQLTYENAFKELKSIMDELQSDKISVDELTSKVKRASELITYCNSMLRDTEGQIASVIKNLGM
ncbi:MAG: exodeoxyribonuclease VII small subunit [Cytophagales bacterium]|jgi:exodeoxyribonuclease VII small subunit|nr:exodeoxyribonuclease VII small subunit [Cytophagales bacterium]MCA6426945.1 exodeoxyribonuclease VII small subunit [Cytophagales bacterium]MCA6431297.1 exodeoxyribonuclease VII small subunit [Cytophagales bacterium]